ncbi:MAG TPA: hypothetical protein VHH34_25890 [Pseudonocardiaceae bacterium]|nr:hypothetical protein [Pseudonocardiaceae bacterium]
MSIADAQQTTMPVPALHNQLTRFVIAGVLAAVVDYTGYRSLLWWVFRSARPDLRGVVFGGGLGRTRAPSSLGLVSRDGLGDRVP